MPSGSELLSSTATTGMPSLLASATAIASLLVSITNRMSGRPPISLMPPSARSSLSRSRVSFSSSFLVRPGWPRAKLLVELAQPLDRLGDRLPVGQHAAEPAVVDVILAAALGRLGDRVLRLALGADEQHAAAAGRRRRARPRSAWCSSGTVCSRSMMWTPLRTPKMYGAIFGFQRRVWWPKCTPASRSWRMVNVGSAMGRTFLFRLGLRGRRPVTRSKRP